MRVESVTLSNVRAHSALQVDLQSGLNVLVGPNGAGKTTVLEAMALVLRGSALRPGSIRDLILRGEGFLRIELRLAPTEGPVTVAAAAYTRDGERRLTADGADLQDPSRWRETLPIRTFVPDDLRLIKGSPRRRREYLDALAGREDPAYRAALREYEEALAQRNALLRSRHAGAEDSQFGPWETMLAETGVLVCARRAARLQSFIGTFQQIYADLTGEPPDTIRLVYRSNVSGLETPQYEARLGEMRAADRQRTFTHLGPHRDDLRLVRRGLDMRDCASQGEQRAALLALVLAEWEQSDDEEAVVGENAAWTVRPGGEGSAVQQPVRPLLLLDDVMSELDEGRRRALVAVVRRGGQALVTTTDLSYFTADELSGACVVDLTPLP